MTVSSVGPTYFPESSAEKSCSELDESSSLSLLDGVEPPPLVVVVFVVSVTAVCPSI